ncbi:hypothetical protein PRZ48_005019 [Zasmidium cellare]|uniref:Potassium transport protein n=1 Tax=Zasmidium cellare TaxID=395010 RepID=A0ABR0ERV4_ZASCE|nr:hypothetical protein PRZ48_005019 [Zasmidium cellare]
MPGVSFGPLNKPLRFLRRQLPPINFITIHYLYFITTCLVSAIILWGSATPAHSLAFIDALFLAVSAMTLAGLNTVNLSTLNTFQQFWLFLLIILGSAILVSSVVVGVRRAAFEKKFKSIFESRKHKRDRSWSRRGRTWSLSRKTTEVQDGPSPGSDGREQGESRATAHDSDRTTEARSVTPPARRGAPEMNGISSDTGEKLNLDRQDTSEDHLEGVDLQPHASALHFRSDTVFHRRHGSQSPVSTRRRPHGIFNVSGVGARPSASLDLTTAGRPPSTAPSVHPPSRGDINRYFESMEGWISRNSQFHGLTDKERARLGGYEYRAVKFLSWLVPAYFILWQLLGCLGCAAWIANNRPDSARSNGLNPWWVGAFNAVSAFNNSGMSLLDANMTAYQTGYYLLITMGLLILAGNTCYPIFLRLIVWTMYKVVQRFEDRSEEWRERALTLKFLLDHPRRCYTNLFPSQHTWWLLLSVVSLNSIDWAAFEILNIGNEYIDAFPVGVRIIDGLFQAFAVRSGGFYVVVIPNLRISLQVLYVVMMYISVYPVVITMRNSNVYEERSLGIYAEDQVEDEQPRRSQQDENPGFIRRLTGRFVPGGPGAKESNSTFVRQQLRAQLAHDAWIIVIALFLIMIIEVSWFDRDPVNFSVFNFLFEIVSGYGCVGISVGIPWNSYSFCGTWHTLSKLILCIVMLRGRHRGLPVAIDRAILLPGEDNEQAEEDDGRIRMARTMSRGRPLESPLPPDAV